MRGAITMAITWPGIRQKLWALAIAGLGVAGLFVFDRPPSLLLLSGLLVNAWITAFHAQRSSGSTLSEIKSEFQSGKYVRPRYVHYLNLLSCGLVIAAFVVNVANH